jgi:hypothetical protein
MVTLSVVKQINRCRLIPEEALNLVSEQKAAEQRRDKVYRLHLRGYTDLDISKEL